MTQPYGPPEPDTSAAVQPDPFMVPPAVQYRHSVPLLIGIGAFSLIAAIAVGYGGLGFPINAPVEQIYAFGIVVDLVAVAIAMASFTVVEFRRRADPRLQGLQLDTSRSRLAVAAVVLAGVALLSWGILGGAGQLIDLAQGVRGRYMHHTAGIFLAGAPWALSLILGGWGFRPGGNRTTNVLALVAIGVGVVLAVIAAAASLIYGAGYSD